MTFKLSTNDLSKHTEKSLSKISTNQSVNESQRKAQLKEAYNQMKISDISNNQRQKVNYDDGDDPFVYDHQFQDYLDLHLP